MRKPSRKHSQRWRSWDAAEDRPQGPEAFARGGVCLCAADYCCRSLGQRRRAEGGDSQQFAFVLAAFFMGAILAFPLFTPFNQVMLILATMLILRDWKTIPRFSRIVFTISVIWPWIVVPVLLVFPPQIDSPSQIPLLPSFLVSFVPLILPLLLMTRHKDAAELPLPATQPQL